jgi:hypothetical protein
LSPQLNDNNGTTPLKLLSFRWKDRDRLGFALDDNRVADLGEIATALGREPYADMLAMPARASCATRRPSPRTSRPS